MFCSLEGLERALPEHRPECSRIVAEKTAGRKGKAKAGADAKQKRADDGAVGPSTECTSTSYYALHTFLMKAAWVCQNPCRPRAEPRPTAFRPRPAEKTELKPPHSS